MNLSIVEIQRGLRGRNVSGSKTQESTGYEFIDC